MLSKKLWNYLSNLILTVLMSFCCVYALISSLVLTYPAWQVFLLVFITALVISLLLYNRTIIKITAVSLVVLLVSLFFYLSYKDLLSTLYENITDLIEWTYNYINGAEYINSAYQAYISLFLSISISFFVYIFTVKYFSFPVLLVSGSALFIAQWMLEYFVSYLAFYIFLFIILIYYSMHIYRKKRSTQENDYASQASLHIWLTPFCAVILLIAFAIPASSKPIEWKWLDKKITAFVDNINNQPDFESFEYFSLASSGFGRNNNTLGGTVNPDKTLVLTVETPRNTYLKGTTKDVYTGSAWISSEKKKMPIDEPASGIYLDTQEMIAGMKLLTGQTYFIDKFFYRDTIKITYQNLKTKSLFVPVKASRYYFIGPKKPVKPLIDSYEILAAGKRLTRGFSYTVDAYGVKYDDENFTNTMRMSKRGLYKDILDYINNHLKKSPDAGTNIFLIKSHSNEILTVDYKVLKSMADNSDSIYKKYLQLPDTLPARVKGLTAEITSSCVNDYDKAKTIEQYLSGNFYYTLNPKPVPAGRDFTDYFLFDSNEGYCTYYATAMAVMARSIGLPARYVEGYMLPSSPASENSYEVTNEQAHAWVEIYFEGFGWLTFEPTSPFGTSFYSNSEITARYSSDFENDPAYRDYLDRLEGYRDRDFTTNIPSGDIGSYAPNRINYKLILKYFLIVLLIVFIINILIRFIAVRIKFLLISRRDTRNCILLLYKQYLKILSLQGLKLGPGETPSTYSKRVDNILIFGNLTFKDISDIFLKARYSKDTLNVNEKHMVVDFCKNFLTETRMNMGNLKYFAYRYILWRF
jgi:transglutaminase-like putative cysteine protease